MPSRRRDCFTPTEPLNPHNLLKSTSTVSPHTMPLPPLSKGGGLTARHKLLLCCVLLATRPPFFIYQTFLPPRRRDCHSTNPPKTVLSLAPHHVLASLVKGRWIDGKAQTVASLRLLAIRLPFQFIKLFCRQDGGIASPPSLACTNPPKPALSPALHHILTPPCQR